MIVYNNDWKKKQIKWILMSTSLANTLFWTNILLNFLILKIPTVRQIVTLHNDAIKKYEYKSATFSEKFMIKNGTIVSKNTVIASTSTIA